MAGLDNATTRGFANLYPAHVAAFSRLLIDLRRNVGGDLDLVLILAVIGELHFARRIDSSEPGYDTLGGTRTNDTPTTNAYSLASYTGIPRETVRRKVTALLDRGWIATDGRGNLIPTPQAAIDLSDGTDAAVLFLEAIKTAAGLSDAISPDGDGIPDPVRPRSGPLAGM